MELTTYVGEAVNREIFMPHVQKLPKPEVSK
jgi:hypothetical protein